VVDVAGGHGLLAHMMLLLDGSSSTAVVRRSRECRPAGGSTKLRERGRESPTESRSCPGEFNEFELTGTDVIVSVHACRRADDEILDRAVAAVRRVAVLPSCHDLNDETGTRSRGLARRTARDGRRGAVATRLGAIRVWTQTISEEITPKNRLLLASPRLTRRAVFRRAYACVLR
jgi:hypothetical protein